MFAVLGLEFIYSVACVFLFLFRVPTDLSKSRVVGTQTKV